MVIKPFQGNSIANIFPILITRMEVDKDVMHYYVSVEKGEAGERRFSELLKGLSENCLVLHDILLEHNNTLFQIDTLIITQRVIYLFEVKNFQGDYHLESGNWYTKSGKEVQNPLLQLKRCESLFRQYLQKYGFNLSVKGAIIFVNSEFTLYQAPVELPAIFPTQLNHFINQVKSNSAKLEKIHYNLAEKLINSHINENPFDNLPDYKYDHLKKGIDCDSCKSLKTFLKERTVVCGSCGHKEIVDSAVIRNIKQFKLLFPNEKVTVSIIHDWCSVIQSKKTIRRIIQNHYTLQGYGRSAHYVER